MHRGRALVWLACLVLLLLPAAGLRVCFGVDHLAFAVGIDDDCPCGDHDDEPCADVSFVVPDLRDDHAPSIVHDVALLAVPHAAIPPPRAPCTMAQPRAPAGEDPVPDRATAVRRSVVLLI